MNADKTVRLIRVYLRSFAAKILFRTYLNY